jgi:hypothetical protein
MQYIISVNPLLPAPTFVALVPNGGGGLSEPPPSNFGTTLKLLASNSSLESPRQPELNDI